MTEPLGIYSKKNAELILEVVRYLRDNGFVVGKGRTVPSIQPIPEIIPVRNDSGEAIPKYACMQVTGTVEHGNQNYIKVVKPVDASGASGGYLFNGHAEIEIGGYGVAQDGLEVRAITDGSSVVCGEKWQPTVGEWTVEPGGVAFSAIGEDDIATNCMRMFVSQFFSDSAYLLHFKSKAGGIPAKSGSTMGSASCDVLDSNSSGVLTDNGTDETIYNALGAFAANTEGLAMQNRAGLWVAIAENC